MSELPKFHEFFAPVLQVLSDGQERTSRQIVDSVADHMGIPQDQREETIPSGMGRMANRILWSLSYLNQAACVHRPKRGVYRITDRGRAVLAAQPGGIAVTDLRQFPEFLEFQNRSASKAQAVEDSTAVVEELTPQEQIATAVQQIESAVAHELIDRIRAQDPEFLEKAVLRLLVAMGYGGSEGHAEHIGGSGDGGMDGVINQDRLGLERIYVQAKRYKAENVVGRPDVQGFVGAMHGMGAAGGVFITTSRFTPDAIGFARDINPRVILIDGVRLAALMIQYGVGVQAREEFRVVEVDEDFFE